MAIRIMQHITAGERILVDDEAERISDALSEDDVQELIAADSAAGYDGNWTGGCVNAKWRTVAELGATEVRS